MLLGDLVRSAHLLGEGFAIVARSAADATVGDEARSVLERLGAVTVLRDALVDSEVPHRWEESTVVVAAEDGSAAIGPVAVALAGASVDLRGLTLRTPTLDDVFLDVTGNRLRTPSSGVGAAPAA